MNARRAAPYVAGALAVLGMAAIGLRISYRSQMRVAAGDSIWRLTYTIDFNASKPGARVRAAFPFDTAYCRIFDHQAISPGVAAEVMRTAHADNREISLTADHAGPARATLQFDLHLRPKPTWRDGAPSGKLSTEERANCLRPERSIQVENLVVTDALSSIRGDDDPKSDALVARIFEFCLTEIAPGGRDSPRDAVGAIERGAAGNFGRARAMVALCRAAKIPARLVAGFEIKLNAAAQTHRWVEVLLGGRWEPFDPENGFVRELPRNFIPVRRDGFDIVRGKDVASLGETYAIMRLQKPERAVAAARSPLDILDLTRLPVEADVVLSLVLLMPLGALATSILRTIIGIRTFGTFTPTLIALSFVYSDWRMGIVVFFIVLTLGLTSRTLIDRLRLLVVPRLSIMLTIVVLCMVFSISAFEYLDWTPTAQAVLLPMVILTMMVERFFLTVEEDGFGVSIRLLAATLAVAFCCYLLLCWNAVGRLLLAYPETHLFTIAVLILLGRYSGYRLVELWRFRDAGHGEG